jgi:hypothetical protein
MKRLRTLLTGGLVLGLYTVGWTAVLRVPSQYPTIQAGIDAAVEGDTVLVADGTYTGDGNRDLDFGGVNMVVMSEHGPEVTIIDCEGDSLDPHRGFYFHGREDSSSVVEGFTITNGFRHGYGGEACGGAVLCVTSSPTIRGDIIIGNTAGGYGGGIHCDSDSRPSIVRSTITGNAACGGGGGIMCFVHSDAYVEDCVISENSAASGGGIGCYHYCYVAVERSVITGNVASSGGGITADWASVWISGSTITGNRASDHGGGIVCSRGSGGIANSILWSDSAETGSEIYLIGSAPYFTTDLWVEYSDVQGGSSAVYVGGASILCWEAGNIDSDPLFVAGPHGGYYLSQTAAGQQEDSPCVDAGDPQSSVPDGTTRTDEVPDSLPVDMGYHYRIGSVVDIGRKDGEPALAVSQCVAQNYPNPFRSSTTIAYSLSKATSVTLAIYDVRGALVRTLVSAAVSAGRHEVTWDGRDARGHKVASGVYLGRLEAGDHAETKRMVLLR